MYTNSKLAITATTIWLITCASYIMLNFGFERFLCLPPNEMGDFFAGVFAPIAFFWLIAGFSRQIYDMRRQHEAMLEAARKAERSERLNRRSMFFQLENSMLTSLEEIAGKIYKKVLPKAKSIHQHYLDSGRKNFKAPPEETGDSINDLYYLLTKQCGKEAFRTFSPNSLVAQWTSRYIAKFELLQAEAKECDIDGLVIFEKSCLEKLHGKLYIKLKETIVKTKALNEQKEVEETLVG